MTETTKCHKCGRTDRRLYHHHRSYEPEEIVMVCMSCHKLLHNRLRRDGLCTIPPYELWIISQKSNHAKKQRIESQKGYMKVYLKEYRILHKEDASKYMNEYRKTHKTFDWSSDTKMMPYVQLRIRIRVNNNKDKISIYSGYYTSHNKKILYIDI